MHYGRTLPTRELKLSLPCARKHQKDDYSQLEAVLSQLPSLTVEYEKPPEAEMAEALAEQLGVTKKIFQARPSPLSCRAPTLARNVCNVPAARSPPEGPHHTDIITALRHEKMTSTAQAELEQERTALETQLEEQRAENERALAAQRAENESSELPGAICNGMTRVGSDVFSASSVRDKIRWLDRPEVPQSSWKATSVIIIHCVVDCVYINYFNREQ